MRLVTGLQGVDPPKAIVSANRSDAHPLKLGGKVPAAKRIQRRNVALGRTNKSTNLRAPVWDRAPGPVEDRSSRV